MKAIIINFLLVLFSFVLHAQETISESSAKLSVYAAYNGYHGVESTNPEISTSEQFSYLQGASIGVVVDKVFNESTLTHLSVVTFDASYQFGDREGLYLDFKGQFIVPFTKKFNLGAMAGVGLHWNSYDQDILDFAVPVELYYNFKSLGYEMQVKAGAQSRVFEWHEEGANIYPRLMYSFQF